MKLMLLSILVSHLGLEMQKREILDIEIVKQKSAFDDPEEEEEEEKQRKLEAKELKIKEFDHIHQTFVELIVHLYSANFFKRTLLHCIQFIPHTTQSTKKRVFLE